MAALQVKDFPPALYNRLKAEAAAEDRSISQQTVHIIRDYFRNAGWVREPEREALREEDWREGGAASRSLPVLLGTPERRKESSLERKRRVFERIHARGELKTSEGFPEPAELIRQMREERDDAIAPELRDVR